MRLPMTRRRWLAFLAVAALSTPAAAGFTGLAVEAKTDAEALAAGLFVCNVYAEFDDSGDRLLLVSSAEPQVPS